MKDDPDLAAPLDEVMLSFADAYKIGERVGEMAGRLKVADKIVPGAIAKCGLTIDGAHFEVALRMAPSGPKES